MDAGFAKRPWIKVIMLVFAMNTPTEGGNRKLQNTDDTMRQLQAYRFVDKEAAMPPLSILTA
jgi:hypothetical protein